MTYATATVFAPIGPAVHGQPRARTCTVEPTPGQDDSPAFRAALESCKSAASSFFKAGVNYNIWSQVASPRLLTCRSACWATYTCPQTSRVCRPRCARRRRDWISITGLKVVWEGAPGEGCRVDRFPRRGVVGRERGEHTARACPTDPHLLAWRASDGVLLRYKSRKPIAWNVGIGAERVLVEDAEIDAVAAPGRGFPFNTVGFGVSGMHVTIRRSRVFNERTTRWQCRMGRGICWLRTA